MAFKYPKPKQVISDQGKGYKSKEYAIYLKDRNTTSKYISTTNPTANGINERITNTIKFLVRFISN